MDAVNPWTLWRAEPLPLALTLTALLFYTLFTGPLRKHVFPGRAYPKGKAALFYLGMGIMTVTFLSPLHTIGELFLVSAHMTTMMIVIFVVAPITLLGTPGWLIAPLVRHPVVRPALRFLTRPTVNVIHFNLAFTLIHLPAVLRVTMFSSDILHYWTYFVIFGSAILMWWTVMNPVPELLPSPGFRGKLIYLLVILFAHNPFSSVLTFYPDILYPWYAAAPRVFNLTPLQDQHLAGVIMGAIYIVVMLTAIAVVFLTWLTTQPSGEQQPSRDVEAEHAEMEVSLLQKTVAE